MLKRPKTPTQTHTLSSPPRFRYVRFWNVLESEAEPVISVIVPKVKEDELLTYCAFNSSGSAVVIG